MKKKKSGAVRYLELNLGNSAGPSDRFTASRFRPDTELGILRVIKRAAGDKKLSGIFINTSGFSANREYLWELRNALEDCKASGKKIVAYFHNADLDLYCLLSMADKIIMDQAGMLTFLGYSWGRVFVKESLKKLGVGFRELRYLEYKSANETFSRTTISEVDREQYGIYLDEIFELSKKTIIENRSLREEDLNSLLSEGILISPREAAASRELGGPTLVDVLGREEAIKETIKGMEFPDIEEGNEKEGKIHFISAGNMHFSFFNQGQKAAHYRAGRARGFRLPEIAVINARGATDLDRGMEARIIDRTIRELGEKPRVKAIIVRINSPGGSALAADFISEAIREVKKEIPVVVSLGQVAASGGYWAAMNASHICASPYTLTGSIGVIAGWFFDKGFNARLGLGFDALTRGDHADLATGIILPRRDLRDDEEAQFRRCIMDLYDEFVKKAAEGRNMKREGLEPLARGRVYSGSASQKLGLTDSLGGYLEALEIARDLAKIRPSKKIRVREYPKPKFFETLAAKIISSASPGILGKLLPAQTRDASQLWEDLSYRLSHNGEAMPILPLDLN